MYLVSGSVVTFVIDFLNKPSAMVVSSSEPKAARPNEEAKTTATRVLDVVTRLLELTTRSALCVSNVKQLMLSTVRATELQRDDCKGWIDFPAAHGQRGQGPLGTWMDQPRRWNQRVLGAMMKDLPPHWMNLRSEDHQHH
ncbi:hypothetical protein BU15DRAFT_62117 [Melanogaster broomeanus]|nr:hypothetical protein BU15DRAFT_62117 [Melanogaster broomeanus]